MAFGIAEDSRDVFLRGFGHGPSSHSRVCDGYNQITMKFIGTVLLAWAVTTGQVQPPVPAPPVGGLFAGAVLLGEAPLTEEALPNGMTMADRLIVVTYLDRRQELSPRFTPTGGRGDAERQRVALEIAATIETDGIETTALSISASLSPLARSVTTTDDPSVGASWAEGLVRDANFAAARPWLYAFLASRYRLQFEQADEDRDLLERLAKKYKTMLDRVRNAGDPLFVVLANDLDNRASLLPGVTRHPRQYLPDT